MLRSCEPFDDSFSLDDKPLFDIFSPALPFFVYYIMTSEYNQVLLYDISPFVTRSNAFYVPCAEKSLLGVTKKQFTPKQPPSKLVFC
jgi:hypothetical protein